MLKKLGIDSLLLFFVLSIAFLWVAFPSIQESLFSPNHYIITNLSVDDQVSYPEQGIYEGGEIRLNNENLTLLFSMDGGKTFKEAPDKGLIIDDLENPAIIYQTASIRWRHPKGKFPAVKNIVLKIRNEIKRTESKPKVLTYFEKGMTYSGSLVNITINHDDLFDWEKGLMIYGESSSHDQGFQKDWWYRSANFASRGPEWGRPARFQYFWDNINGNGQTDIRCEMKISGNATRYFPQKSLKFKILDEQGKPSKAPAFFSAPDGRPMESSSLLLRQGGNDNSRTLFADLFMHRLAENSEVAALEGSPLPVFINGNYWGIYNMRQRIDPLYIAEIENEKEKNITILYCEVYGDRSILKDGSKKEKARFDSLISSLPEQISSEADYRRVRDQISIKSFVDYIIFETYYANQDWLHNNTTWYKAGGKKWKWILNDLDFSLAYPGTDNVNSNLFDKLLTRNSITGQLFTSLIAYPEFKERFQNRVIDLLEVEFSEERVKWEFQQVKEMYSAGIDRQIRRWRFIDSIEQWEKDCAENETFLLERRTIYQKQVQAL